MRVDEVYGVLDLVGVHLRPLELRDDEAVVELPADFDLEEDLGVHHAVVRDHWHHLAVLFGVEFALADEGAEVVVVQSLHVHRQDVVVEKASVVAGRVGGMSRVCFLGVAKSGFILTGVVLLAFARTRGAINCFMVLNLRPASTELNPVRVTGSADSAKGGLVFVITSLPFTACITFRNSLLPCGVVWVVPGTRVRVVTFVTLQRPLLQTDGRDIRVYRDKIIVVVLCSALGQHQVEDVRRGGMLGWFIFEERGSRLEICPEIPCFAVIRHDVRL
ncbi:chitinase A precursor [Babesia caballi]|uniref:Chitinase A n=1 Tax=Babesia caballi TaxID=5871 RepID=A0AAV4LYN2_BABCB|nr:chitinase A precursor [Babesia caballi]